MKMPPGIVKLGLNPRKVLLTASAVFVTASVVILFNSPCASGNFANMAETAISINQEDISAGEIKLSLKEELFGDVVSRIREDNILEDYRVTGVIIGKSNTVMIQTKEKGTVFLTKGDLLQDAIVKDISAEKVVFEYQGKLVQIEY